MNTQIINFQIQLKEKGPKKIQVYPHKSDIDPEWKNQQDRRTK